MKQNRMSLWLLSVAAGIAVCSTSAWAQSVEGAEGPRDLPTRGDGVASVTYKSAAVSKNRRVGKAVTLDALDVSALEAEDASRSGGEQWKRYNRVGVVRSFERVDAPRSLRDNGKSERLPDGTYVWRMEIASEGATAMRLRICECDLPAGAQLFVYDANEPDEIYGPFVGGGPNADGEFLTPSVFSDRAILEVRTPRRVSHRRLKLAVDGVVHSYRELARAEMSHDHEPRMGLGCMNNIACDSDWYADVSRAVATFDFTQGGDQFSCSGTLINDSDDSTVIPWFLTANHCVGSDSVARTVEVFFDFKATTCGGSAPSLQSVPRTNGATLAYTRSQSDGTLIRLTGTLPSNRFFCGWTAETPAIGTSVVGVHHPEATHMRISYGKLTQGREAGLHEVTWDDGVTAQGSSGSALFNLNKQIIGDLCCGGSYCNRQDDPDYYGRFDVNYTAGFDDHLGGDAGTPPDPTPDPGPTPTPDPEPQPEPETDLDPVSNLRSTVRRNGKVILRWSDEARGELGYRVDIQSGSGWTRLADMRRNRKRFKHVPGDGTHVYRVGPYDEQGTAWTQTTVVVGDGGGSTGGANDDTPSGATLIAVGSTSATDSVSRSDQQDWFKVSLEADVTYLVYSTGRDDTVGAIFGDESGRFSLDENDDDPNGFDFNFGMEFTPDTSGTYWVRVTAFAFSPNASYQLVVEEL